MRIELSHPPAVQQCGGPLPSSPSPGVSEEEQCTCLRTCGCHIQGWVQGVSPLLWEVPWEAAQGVLTVLQGALLGANTSVELVAEPSALGISSNQPVLGAGTMDRGQIQIPPGAPRCVGETGQAERSNSQSLEGWKHSGHGVHSGPAQRNRQGFLGEDEELLSR